MKKIYILFFYFIFFTMTSLAESTDRQIRDIISRKTQYIQHLTHFKKIHENEKWSIFSYIATLSNENQGPKNLYVYVPKDAEISQLKIRMHGFLPFPFPSVTYSQFLQFRNDSSSLDYLISPIIGTEAADKLKKHFINSLILDFATDDDYEGFFHEENALFSAFKSNWLDNLEQITRWNEKTLRALKGNLTQPIPKKLLEDKDFAAYKQEISLLGIDFVFPYITDSDCKRCFMMIAGYTPADNYSGFLWIEDEKQLPEWSPSGIFFRRSLGGGWYVFRST